MIPQFYIMVAVTLIAAVALFGWAIYALSGRDRRYPALILLGLPLPVVLSALVIRPLGRLAGQAAGGQVVLGYALLVWLLPAFLVEAVKALPVLLPVVRRLMASRAGATWVGLALGVGFALGESIYLGFEAGLDPRYAGYPWYAFGGFFFERMVACFAHAITGAILLDGIWLGGRRLLFGYLAAVFWQVLLAAGAVLAGLGWITPAAGSLVLIAVLVQLVLIFERQRRLVLQADN